MAGHLRRRLLAGARTALPDASVPWLARAGTWLDVHRPAQVERARAEMRLLLGAARPSHDLHDPDGLARGYLAQMRWRREARWHPERWWPAVPVTGVEHLAAAPEGGALSFLHHGVYNQLGVSLTAAGVPVTVMVHPNLVRPDATPWDASIVRAARCEVFSAAEGAEGVRRRLLQGAIVAVASDGAGSLPLTFLGREVRGSYGPVRVAFETGRPVYALRSHPGDGSPFLSVSEPLWPADHDSPQELVKRLLALHEEAVLAWPEAYDEPSAKCFPAHTGG